MKDFFKKIRKAIVKRFFLEKINDEYIRTPARKTVLQPLKSDFLLAVIFFNNAELLRLQYASSSKNLEDAFDYLVVDDSSDEHEAAAMESFCTENGISYVRLPDNPGLDASLCYSFALNWTYHNVVDKAKPRYFGVVDSDMFFISKGSMLSHLGSEDYWGFKVNREKSWYLWANFFVFRYDFLKSRKVNFMPEGERDCGGGNYGILKNTATAHLMPTSAVEDRKFGESGSAQFFLNVIHLGATTSVGRGLRGRQALLWKLIKGD